DRRIGEQPAPIARVMPALARGDREIDRMGAAAAERKRGAVARHARAVRGDEHVGSKQIAVLRAYFAQARRPGLLAHLDEPFGVEAEPAAHGEYGGERREVDRVLALVVDDAAAPVTAV